jgi:small subunit ribosomal protein S18
MSTDTPRPSSPSRPPYGGGSSRPAGAPGSRPPYNPAGRPSMGPGGKGRPMMRQRLCRICEERKGFVDWKAVNYLRGFITERGKILAGRSKGLCAPCQRNLARAIKRARNIALLPTSPV